MMWGRRQHGHAHRLANVTNAVRQNKTRGENFSPRVFYFTWEKTH